MANSPLIIRPYLLWGGGVALGGGTLDSHERNCTFEILYVLLREKKER